MKNTKYTPAKIRSASFDADANTVDIVWTTGAAVRRADYYVEFDEVLSLEPGAVRLDRLNAGASFLDAHNDCAVANILGVVLPDTARI
jgi:hypothetical protein